MCKISVIAPVYCMEKYILQFLKSVERQSLQEIEVILVDDGSFDKCPQILDEFARKDKRYRVVHQTNKGVCAARNKALSYAKGKYVYIVDSDDWLADDALEILWKEAVRTDADVIYGQTITERPNGSFIEKPFPNAFCTENKATLKAIQCALNNNNVIKVKCPEFNIISCLGGAPWRAMVRRSLITEHAIKYDESLKSLGEDILFWQQIYEYVYRVAYIEEPIYHYRIIECSLSHGYKKNLFEIYENIFDKQECFLHHYKKDEDHWNAYYFRVIIYIRQAMTYYFQNKNNKQSEKKRFEEFCSLLQREPYVTAIKQVPLRTLKNPKTQFSIMLLRLRLFRLFWILKRIKS